MRVFIERARHIAILALGSLFVASINAAPNSFQWEVQSESHALSGLSGFKIAVLGDSLTAARPFIDAVLDANGIRKTAVMPSHIQAGIGIPGLALPLRTASINGAWQIAYAHKENQPRPAYAKGYLRMHAQTPTHSLVHRRIALAQQQIAPEFRCAFWDWQAAMGGPGTAARWAGTTPPLMQQDLTHPTAKGYALSGRMFAKAFPFDKSNPD